MNNFQHQDFLKSEVRTYAEVLFVLVLTYAMAITTYACLGRRKVEDILLAEESLLSLYFLVPLSLGILFELRQHKLSDRGTARAFARIVALFMALAAITGFRYAWIVGAAILIFFFLGFYSGKLAQRHVIKPAANLLLPFLKSLQAGSKVFVGYLVLSALIAFTFGLVYAQLQIHSSCQFGTLGQLLEHFLNSVFLMVSFTSLGSKGSCDSAQGLHLFQSFLFYFVLTPLFTNLMRRAIRKRKKHNSTLNRQAQKR
jgi:hypothetical protein